MKGLVSYLLASRTGRIAAALVMVIAVGGLFAYEPVTRDLVATEFVCTYCHAEREYSPMVWMSWTRPHPPSPVQAQCVDCHLPEGFWATTFAYTHFASVTDLFGHFRDRASERAGDWIPPSAARAYRTRQRLFEYDSVTCRSCHIEAEIKPKRKRGQKAHAKALENKETCIECHDNMVHRYIEVQKNEFQKPQMAEK
jgi:nitrate/TMAO reductase-like tetraheme cytochrome c subunit